MRMSVTSVFPIVMPTAAFFILKIGRDIVIHENVLCSVLVPITCLALLAAAAEEKAPKSQYDKKRQRGNEMNRR